ncbi:MAG TPA: MCE family protein [Actinomycetota bacterium]|nr:MCE family protein [Actinomycetota bacterium]
MRSTAVKLSVFTAFTIFVTFWLASVIGRLEPFKDSYSVEAAFTDATGILVGDLVKIAGVDVGKVTGFRVEDGEAILTLQLDSGVEVPSNVGAEIKYRNLLGQRTVNLTRPERESSQPLEDGDLIPSSNTEPALDLSIVFNNLRPLIQSTNPEDINTVARAVVEVFKGREGDLAGILGNVGELADTLSDRDQRLARLVGNLDDVTKILNSQSGNIKASLRQFSTFLESLHEVSPTIARVVDQLEEAARKFGGVVVRNRSNLDQELEDLTIVLDVVNDNLGPLSRVAKNLKEILLATARSQSYGKWWNLYVVNYCPEVGTPQNCTIVTRGTP